MSRWKATAATLMMAVALEGCPSDQPTTPPADEFEFGPSTIYSLPGSGPITITDSVTGGTFLFTSVGGGTLTVARIRKAPVEGPLPGEGFHIEFNGNGPAQLLLAYTEGTVPLVWGYALPQYSTYDSQIGSGSWLPIRQQDSVGNPAVFELVLPGDPVSGKRAASTATTAFNIWKATIDKSSGIWEKLHTLAELTRQTIQGVYDELPPSVQSRVLPELNGRLKPQVYTAWTAGDSYYHPFVLLSDQVTGARIVDPYFCYVLSTATPSTVAHEVGHYWSHVLLGDDLFEELSRQALRNHNIGESHSGRRMLEEYAMFTDYFLYSKVKGGIEITEPFEFVAANINPRSVDFPGVEGYGCALLSRLHVDKRTIIRDPAELAEDIPMIGADVSEIYGLLAEHKPVTVDQLRGAVAIFLRNRGEEDRLPAILERTGWSYHGRGTIVDIAGVQVANAQIQTVCRVPSEQYQEYLAPLDPTTSGSDGRFTIDRLFPGRNYLRVTVNGTVREIPIDIDPNAPTNVEIDLGRITFPNRPSILGKLRQTDRIEALFRYSSDYQITVYDKEGVVLRTLDDPDRTDDWMVSNYLGWSPPVNAVTTWRRDTFETVLTASAATRIDKVQMTGVIDSTLDRVRYATVRYVSRSTVANPDGSYDSSYFRYRIMDIPLSEGSHSDYSVFVAGGIVDEASIKDHCTEMEAGSYDYCERCGANATDERSVRNYLRTNWNDPFYSLLYIRFEKFK